MDPRATSAPSTSNGGSGTHLGSGVRSSSASGNVIGSRLNFLGRATARLQSLVSDASSRLQLGRWFGGLGADGVSFNGRRDLYDALGYARIITLRAYYERYQRGGIAGRVVEAYPKALWGSGPDVFEDEDPTVSTPFEADLELLVKRLNVWSVFIRAHILAAIGHYSVILIGARDRGRSSTSSSSTPGDISTPLPRMSGPEDILYLKPLPEWRAKISAIVTDADDERFGLPLTYQVAVGSPANFQIANLDLFGFNNSGLITKPCHWTRIIHVSVNRVEDDIYGTPTLRRIWNRLDDLEKLLGGGSEAAWNRIDPGTQFDIDPTLDIGDEDMADLEEEIGEFRQGMSRDIFTRGVKATVLSGSPANFDKNADCIMAHIAGTSEIPQRILLGSERGSLASEQDRNNWDDRIKEGREEDAVPHARLFIDRCLDHGALSPLSNADDYTVHWPKIDALDDKDRASTMLAICQANQAQSHAGGVAVMTEDEIRDRIWGMEPGIKPETPQTSSDNPSATPPTASPPADDQVSNDGN